MQRWFSSRLLVWTVVMMFACIILILPCTTAATSIAEQTSGKILLQVEHHGEAWYVDPASGKRHYLGSPNDAYQLMTQLGIGITTANLRQIEKAGKQDGDRVPDSYLLDIPFTSQAPTGDWSAPSGEACEEAILVMVSHWKAGTGFSASQVESEIYNIVDWENTVYGKNEDTSVNETANTAEQLLGLNVHTSRTVTIKRLKQLISEGKPVMVPVFGQAIGNVHYSNNGPLYHMVLLIGYDGDEFITHDPGTRYGASYRYNVNMFDDAYMI